MISQEILDVIMQESETMVIEWADSKDGYGLEIIDAELHKAFIETEKLKEEELNLLKNSIRNLLVQDMIVMGW